MKFLLVIYGTLYIIDFYLHLKYHRSLIGEGTMLLDALRLFVAFGGVILIVAFWYWVMDSLGTF